MTEIVKGRTGEDIPVERFSADPDVTFGSLSVSHTNQSGLDSGWIPGDILRANNVLYVEAFKKKPGSNEDMKKTVLLEKAMADNPYFNEASIEAQYGISVEDMTSGKTGWDSLADEAEAEPEGADDNPWSIENFPPSSDDDSGQGGRFGRGTTPVNNPGPRAVREASLQEGNGVEGHGNGIYSINNE